MRWRSAVPTGPLRRTLACGLCLCLSTGGFANVSSLAPVFRVAPPPQPGQEEPQPVSVERPAFLTQLGSWGSDPRVELFLSQNAGAESVSIRWENGRRALVAQHPEHEGVAPNHIFILAEAGAGGLQHNSVRRDSEGRLWFSNYRVSDGQASLDEEAGPPVTRAEEHFTSAEEMSDPAAPAAPQPGEPGSSTWSPPESIDILAARPATLRAGQFFREEGKLYYVSADGAPREIGHNSSLEVHGSDQRFQVLAVNVGAEQWMFSVTGTRLHRWTTEISNAYWYRHSLTRQTVAGRGHVPLLGIGFGQGGTIIRAVDAEGRVYARQAAPGGGASFFVPEGPAGAPNGASQGTAGRPAPIIDPAGAPARVNVDFNPVNIVATEEEGIRLGRPFRGSTDTQSQEYSRIYIWHEGRRVRLGTSWTNSNGVSGLNNSYGVIDSQTGVEVWGDVYLPGLSVPISHGQGWQDIWHVSVTADPPGTRYPRTERVYLIPAGRTEEGFSLYYVNDRRDRRYTVSAEAVTSGGAYRITEHTGPLARTTTPASVSEGQASAPQSVGAPGSQIQVTFLNSGGRRFIFAPSGDGGALAPLEFSVPPSATFAPRLVYDPITGNSRTVPAIAIETTGAYHGYFLAWDNGRWQYAHTAWRPRVEGSDEITSYTRFSQRPGGPGPGPFAGGNGDGGDELGGAQGPASGPGVNPWGDIWRGLSRAWAARPGPPSAGDLQRAAGAAGTWIRNAAASHPLAGPIRNGARTVSSAFEGAGAAVARSIERERDRREERTRQAQRWDSFQRGVTRAWNEDILPIVREAGAAAAREHDRQERQRLARERWERFQRDVTRSWTQDILPIVQEAGAAMAREHDRQERQRQARQNWERFQRDVARAWTEDILPIVEAAGESMAREHQRQERERQARERWERFQRDVARAWTEDILPIAEAAGEAIAREQRRQQRERQLTALRGSIVQAWNAVLPHIEAVGRRASSLAREVVAQAGAYPQPPRPMAAPLPPPTVARPRLTSPVTPGWGFLDLWRSGTATQGVAPEQPPAPAWRPFISLANPEASLNNMGYPTPAQGPFQEIPGLMGNPWARRAYDNLTPRPGANGIVQGPDETASMHAIWNVHMARRANMGQSTAELPAGWTYGQPVPRLEGLDIPGLVQPIPNGTGGYTYPPDPMGVNPGMGGPGMGGGGGGGMALPPGFLPVIPNGPVGPPMQN